MDGRRSDHFSMSSWLLAILAGLVLAACGTSTAPRPAAPTPRSANRGDMGTIAYVDANGCIARVPANGSAATERAFCPETHQGVTFIAWQDAYAIAYVVPETGALGWREIDFETGADVALSVAEAPRIRLLTTAPWYRSARGEVVEFDAAGVLYRLDEGRKVAIFSPSLNRISGTPRLATWSPDSEWLLLFASPDDALWVVRRDGSASYQIAASSKAQVSWFMPNAGALPHLDLTCTTAAAFNCRVSLQSPADGALVPGSVLLEWSLCPGATGYEIEVWAPGADKPVVQHLSVATTFRAPAMALAGGTTWRWKVRPVVGTQPGPWSEERAFRLTAGGSP